MTFWGARININDTDSTRTFLHLIDIVVDEALLKGSVAPLPLEVLYHMSQRKL